MSSMRDKLKRKLSMHDKNPNFDEEVGEDDVDDETHGNISREIEKSEQNDKHPQGKPGSFLNRMISHGNKKTEDQIAEDHARATQQQSAQDLSSANK